jgi:hypothetical protein
MLIKIIKKIWLCRHLKAKKRAGEHEMEKERKLVEKDQSGGFLLHLQKRKK